MLSALRSRDYARLLVAGKLLLATCIITYISVQIRPSVLLESLRQGDGVHILAATLLLAPNLGLQYLKWRLLSRLLRADLARADVAGSLFAGFSAGIITPARIGEIAGRALYLRSVSRPQAVGLTMVDKFSSVIVTLIAGFCGIFWILIQKNMVSVYVWYPLAVLLALLLYAGVYLILHPPLLRRLIAVLPAEGKFRRRFTELSRGLERLEQRHALALLGLSALFYLTFAAQYVLFLTAFWPLPVPYAAAAVAAALFSKTVIPPITFGELGIREGSAVYFATLFGASAAAGFNASILIFSINVLVPAIAGLFFLPRLSLGNGELRG